MPQKCMKNQKNKINLLFYFYIKIAVGLAKA
jgi:hypothetical protein